MSPGARWDFGSATFESEGLGICGVIRDSRAYFLDFVLAGDAERVGRLLESISIFTDSGMKDALLCSFMN